MAVIAEKCGGQEAKAKAKAKARRKVTNMLMDGLGVASNLTHGGRRKTGREDLVQDGGRQQTTGHHGNQKNQWVKLRSTAWKDAAARALEGAQKQIVRRWQGPRTSETSSTSGTSESDRRRRGTPTEQRVMVPPAYTTRRENLHRRLRLRRVRQRRVE